MKGVFLSSTKSRAHSRQSTFRRVWVICVTKFVLIFSLVILSPCAFASEKEPATEMNGHSLREFVGFEKNWKLVTVRFRKDTGELRFTYANDLAWKNLKAG